MNTIENSAAPAATETKLSKAMTEVKEAVSAVRKAANPADVAKAKAMVASGQNPRVERISPAVASCLILDHNVYNRNLSVPRARGYADDMANGEWKVNHQGIAFYEDGTLADGQHRMYGLVLSGTEQEFMVSNDFSKSAIDTIDRSTRRSAGESLEMMGISHGKDKAAIMKTAMDYIFREEHGATPRFTDPKIESAVLEHEGVLDEAIKIGRQSIENVTDPCLNWKEAATITALMLLGRWQTHYIVGFLSSIQQGTAHYPESPTTLLSKLFMRAKINARRQDKLSKQDKLALSLKGANLWVANASVARLKFNGRKESLPTHQAPVIQEPSANPATEESAAA